MATAYWLATAVFPWKEKMPPSLVRSAHLLIAFAGTLSTCGTQ